MIDWRNLLRSWCWSVKIVIAKLYIGICIFQYSIYQQIRGESYAFSFILFYSYYFSFFLNTFNFSSHLYGFLIFFFSFATIRYFNWYYFWEIEASTTHDMDYEPYIGKRVLKKWYPINDPRAIWVVVNLYLVVPISTYPMPIYLLVYLQFFSTNCKREL